MNISQKRTWWVDTTLFAGMLVAFFLDFTGVGIHQWLGIILGALAVYHLIAHWSWVRAVSQRFFGKTSGRARTYYLLDGALFASLAEIIATGLVISTWLNLSLTNFSAWLAVHISVSIVTLVLVVIKLGLHWRWIATTTRKAITKPATAPAKPTVAPQVVATKRMNRREFLEVMGVTGAASLIALAAGVQSLQSLQGGQTTAYAQTETSSTVASTAAQVTTNNVTSSANTGSSSSACTVRCPRGCSYPGRCGRYTDSNGNNRCDLGECL